MPLHNEQFYITIKKVLWSVGIGISASLLKVPKTPRQTFCYYSTTVGFFQVTQISII